MFPIKNTLSSFGIKYVKTAFQTLDTTTLFGLHIYENQSEIAFIKPKQIVASSNMGNSRKTFSAFEVIEWHSDPADVVLHLKPHRYAY